MSEGSSSDSASEPEPGSGHRPGPVTVGGVRRIGESSTPYTVFADISETHENVLPELRLIEQDGRWVMQEPRDCQEPETCVQTKDNQDAIEVQATLRELEALEALENIGALNAIFPVTSDRDLSGYTECHESPGVTHSPSSDQDHVSNTSIPITPPRHEPFVFEPHSDRYPGRSQIVQLQNDWADILSGALEGNAGQQEVVAEIVVSNNAEIERHGDETQDAGEEDRQNDGDIDQVENGQGSKKTKGQRRNRKKEEAEKKKAEKEQKKSSYDQAVKALKENKYESYSACAKAYGVSDVTLRRIILRNKGFVGQGRPNEVLKPDEEEKLVSHLKYCANVGFGLSLYDVQLLIQELLTAVVR